MQVSTGRMRVPAWPTRRFSRAVAETRTCSRLLYSSDHSQLPQFHWEVSEHEIQTRIRVLDFPGPIPSQAWSRSLTPFGLVTVRCTAGETLLPIGRHQGHGRTFAEDLSRTGLQNRPQLKMPNGPRRCASNLRARHRSGQNLNSIILWRKPCCRLGDSAGAIEELEQVEASARRIISALILTASSTSATHWRCRIFALASNRTAHFITTNIRASSLWRGRPSIGTRRARKERHGSLPPV